MGGEEGNENRVRKRGIRRESKGKGLRKVEKRRKVEKKKENRIGKDRKRGEKTNERIKENK